MSCFTVHIKLLLGYSVGWHIQDGSQVCRRRDHFTLLIIIVQSQLCSCTAGETSTRVGSSEAQYCEAHKPVIRYTQLMHGYDLKLLLFITSQNLPSAIVRP